MLFFIEYTLKHNTNNANLNTSHVILYRLCIRLALCPSYVFKYISCYSLSILTEDNFISHTHLNTSHVILYQSRREDLNRTKKHLNTSHVILYPATVYVVGRK